MKKIFAFILATIMVMSLIPASVFAAFTKQCPDIHTIANCTYEKVKTVAPTCTKTGYTLYVCSTCGVQFTDDVKPTTGHNYVSDPDNAKYDIAASCLYKQDGIAHLRCSVCKTKKVEEVSYKSTKVHNLVKVSGIGCEELYECTICGEQGYIVKEKLEAKAAHTLEFKGIITEPYRKDGVSHDGVALYACKTKGCEYEKEVVVVCPDCDCAEDTSKLVKVVSEKDSTCAAEGTYGVYKCAECAKLYYDTNLDAKKTVYAPLTDVNEDKAITVADAIIPAKAHTKPAANQITTNGCTIIYTCTKCKQTIVEEKHTDVRDDIMTPIAATCMTYGVTYKVCTGCGYSWPELIDPLGHKEAELIIESNCAVQGGKYTYCTREDCPLTATTPKNAPAGTLIKVVKAELFPLDKTKHDIEYVGGSDFDSTASCTTSGLVITTCKNGCAEYAVPKVEFKPATQHNMVPYTTSHNCSVSGATLTSWTSRTYFQCTNCGLNTKEDYQALGYTKAYYVDTRDTSIKVEFATLEDALEYHAVYYRTWKVVDDKLVVDELIDRSDVSHGYTHIKEVKSTCKALGYDIYKCEGCGQQFTVKKADEAIAHKDSSKKDGTAATCNTAGKHTTYTCSVCKLTYYYNLKGEQVVFTGTAVINPCGSTLELVLGCGEDEYYKCTECNTYYADEACTKPVAPSQVTDHAWKTLYGGVAATCNSDGIIEIRYCTECNLTEVNALYIYGGKELRLNLATGNYKDAEIVVTVNNEKIFSKIVTIIVDTKAKVTFLCETVTTSNCPVPVLKINHVNPETGLTAITAKTNDSAAKADHTAPMFTRHICAGCDYEYIDHYVAAAAGHINKDGSILTTNCDNEGVKGNRVCVLCVKAGKSTAEATITVAHTLSDKTTSTMTCINDGYSYQYCTKCGFGSPEGLVVSNAKTYHDGLAKNIDASYEAGKVWVNGTIADYAHNGSYTWACSLCDAKVKDGSKGDDKIAAGLEIYVTADTTTFLPGSTVKVTVSLESLKGVNVWALAFPVIFDAEVFDYVGYEFNTAGSAFQTFAINELAGGYTEANFPGAAQWGALTDGKFNPSGILSIVANADADTLVKSEQVLCTLEFKVISAEAQTGVFFKVEETTANVGGVIGQTMLELYGNDIDPWSVDPELNPNGTKYKDQPMWVSSIGVLYQLVKPATAKTIAIEVLNANGQKVKANYNGTNRTEALEVAAFLDLDGKEGITLADAYELYALIYNNEYDVKADANYDGKINGQDLSILYSVYTGVITIEQLVAPDAELPEGWYAGLGGR